MSRIFDALRKARLAETVHGPAAMPAPRPDPPQFHSATLPSPQPISAPKTAIHSAAARTAPHPIALPEIHRVEAMPLPDDLVRELQTLRIGIEAALEDRDARTILFTSPQGGEGTSTVASQFALLLASDTRMRTLLVDLHARRPSLAARFGLDAEVAATPTERPLAVLPMPGEFEAKALFPPASARGRLDAVTGRFDWIVLDGPPLLEAPESTELATLADGVVLVLESGGSKRPVVTHAVEQLRKAGARILGSVLNRRRLEIPDFIYRRL